MKPAPHIPSRALYDVSIEYPKGVHSRSRVRAYYTVMATGIADALGTLREEVPQAFEGADPERIKVKHRDGRCVLRFTIPV